MGHLRRHDYVVVAASSALRESALVLPKRQGCHLERAAKWPFGAWRRSLLSIVLHEPCTEILADRGIHLHHLTYFESGIPTSRNGDIEG